MDNNGTPDVRRAIFADDGAPASDVAWAWLTSHRWTDWRLGILTVRETLFPGRPALGKAHYVERQPPAEAGFDSWTHDHVDGDPRVVLLENSDASLLVLGSHHKGHLAGMWAGSTSEYLLVNPPIPLLLARHGHRTRTVAVCVDGSPHALDALTTFLALPWSSDAEITLVSVADGATEVESTLAAAREAFVGRAQPAEVHLAGEPRKVIPTLVDERGFDLIVLGTRGLKGVTRMTAGSTVSALVKDETANLLIAHVAET